MQVDVSKLQVYQYNLFLMFKHNLFLCLFNHLDLIDKNHLKTSFKLLFVYFCIGYKLKFYKKSIIYEFIIGKKEVV